MGPREFCKTVVLPDIKEFRNNEADHRIAHHAVASVDALAAHIYEWCRNNNKNAVAKLEGDSQYRNEVAKLECDSHYRNEIAKKYPAFSLLRDIAKAQKHVILTRGNPEISGAKDVSVTAAHYNSGARWNDGWRFNAQQYAVKTKNGENRPVLTLVTSGLEILQKEMTMVGVP